MLYNINPSLWGPHFWQAMHYISVAYPQEPTIEDKENLKLFINSLKNIIPCEKCRLHFSQHFNKNPLTDIILSSRINVINWFRNIHNYVNVMTGKKTWTYDDVINKYETNQSNNSNKTQMIVTTSLFSLILIILIVYLRNKKLS